MKTRIGQYQTLKVGDMYEGVRIKIAQEISGAQCHHATYYDNERVIKNTDKVLRIVL